MLRYGQCTVVLFRIIFANFLRSWLQSQSYGLEPIRFQQKKTTAATQLTCNTQTRNACHPDAGPPEVPTNSDVRSPEEALLEALALYNAIFPPVPLDETQPVIAVQATRNAYYREHLYN